MAESFRLLRLKADLMSLRLKSEMVTVVPLSSLRLLLLEPLDRLISMKCSISTQAALTIRLMQLLLHLPAGRSPISLLDSRLWELLLERTQFDLTLVLRLVEIISTLGLPRQDKDVLLSGTSVLAT